MRIGVIGSGHMGASLSRLLAGAGHDILISNSRGPDSLRDLTQESGGRTVAGTVAQAIEFGDVVVVAVPFVAIEDVAAQGRWDRKIVVDVTNYYAQRDGVKVDPSPLSSSEVVAEKLAGARVVKAWNTIWYRRLQTQARGEDGEPLAVLYAGDDEDARALVARLIEDTGFAPVYSGTLAESRNTQEPGAPLYNVPVGEDEARRRVAQQN